MGWCLRPVPWQEAHDDPSTLLEGDPAVVFLCRPNNPTGAQLSEDWVERLIGLAEDAVGGEARGPLIVLDEAYADFAEETLIEWAPRLPRFLVTRTCSKAYGLAGLRCAASESPIPSVVLEVDKSRGPYKVARLAIELAASAVRDADGWVARVVDECLQNRWRLAEAIDERDLDQLPSSANFILLASPSGSTPPRTQRHCAGQVFRYAPSQTSQTSATRFA